MPAFYVYARQYGEPDLHRVTTCETRRQAETYAARMRTDYPTDFYGCPTFYTVSTDAPEPDTTEPYEQLAAAGLI
jgi:hypothetical protein